MENLTSRVSVQFTKTQYSTVGRSLGLAEPNIPGGAWGHRENRALLLGLFVLDRPESRINRWPKSTAGCPEPPSTGDFPTLRPLAPQAGRRWKVSSGKSKGIRLHRGSPGGRHTLNQFLQAGGWLIGGHLAWVGHTLEGWDGQ